MFPPLASIVLLGQVQPPSGEELARAALAAFEAKCVQCHGKDLPHPRSDFGVVNDLGRLVAAGEYVIPGRPEDSEVWKEISDGDMPPDEAKAGPLTEEEERAIYAWIAAGAPTGVSRQVTAQEPAEDRSPAAAPGVPLIAEPQQSMADRVTKLLGRLHVLVVHFPIAMLTAAAIAEGWATLRRRATPAPGVGMFLWIGAFGAVAAAALGWVRALDGYTPPFSHPFALANLHRWIGTMAALAAPAVALAAQRESRRERSWRVRTAIFALGVCVGLAGHFGGLLTHGRGFFDL
jgi:uncharacterized membrane protein